MCISTATFSFVGVEVIAASALEARWPLRIPDARKAPGTFIPNRGPIVGSTVRFTAKYISVFVTAAYVLLGFLATINIPYNDPDLPRVAWVSGAPQSKGPGKKSQSVFVTIASKSGIPELDTVMNVFLIFTCITCAGTNLYIASRALFGLASQLNRSNAWHLTLIGSLGKTEERRKVPRRAIIFSTIVFCWIPYLELLGDNTESDSSIDMVRQLLLIFSRVFELTIAQLVEVLSSMASVGVLIVWACECLAFIRFYHW